VYSKNSSNTFRRRRRRGWWAEIRAAPPRTFQTAKEPVMPEAYPPLAEKQIGSNHILEGQKNFFHMSEKSKLFLGFIIILILLIVSIRIGNNVIGGFLGAVIGGMVGGVLISVINKIFKVDLIRNFSATLNTPTKKSLYFFLVILSLIILVVIFITPILTLYKFGPTWIKSSTNFNSQYSYTLSDSIESGQMVVLAFGLYLIPVLILFSSLMMKITFYLKDRISWTNPQEFSHYTKWYRLLKTFSVFSVVVLLFGLYLQLDTYLLIGDKGILYNGPFTFQSKDYGWGDIKNVVSYTYPKSGTTDYFLIFKDLTKVIVDRNGAVFVSQRAGLSITESKDFKF